MTSFSTALNMAGGIKQTTPQAIMPKAKPKVVQPTVSSSSFKKPKSPVNQQVSNYGKAMNSAIKNTMNY